MLTLGVFVYRLTDTQFKLDALDKESYALSSLARPLPFRGKHTHIKLTHNLELVAVGIRFIKLSFTYS